MNYSGLHICKFSQHKFLWTPIWQKHVIAFNEPQVTLWVKKVKSCCTALQKLLELVQNTAYCNCNMSHYSQLHYTVIWCNALFWTQLNHAVHYVTAPLHCIALVCITLCKHEHCTVHWQCSPVTLGCTIHWTMHCVTSLSTSLSLH